MDLISFIHHDNTLKEEKEKKEKTEQQRKTDREDQIKKLDSQIQAVKGEIEKNKDQLNGLKEYQDFMLDLSGPEFKKEMDQ